MTLPPREAVEAVLAHFPEIRGPVRLDSQRLDAFLEALYHQGLILPFEWTAWADTGQAILADPQRLESIDAETVCRLLTVLVRADRFSGGTIEAALGDGRLGALMCRMEALLPDWPCAAPPGGGTA